MPSVSRFGSVGTWVSWWLTAFFRYADQVPARQRIADLTDDERPCPDDTTNRAALADFAAYHAGLSKYRADLEYCFLVAQSEASETRRDEEQRTWDERQRAERLERERAQQQERIDREAALAKQRRVQRQIRRHALLEAGAIRSREFPIPWSSVERESDYLFNIGALG